MRLKVKELYYLLFHLYISPFSLGLDPKVLSSVVNQASGRCWSSDTYNPCPGVMENVPSSNNYQGGFKTGLMAKVCIFGIINFFFLLLRKIVWFPVDSEHSGY